MTLKTTKLNIYFRGVAITYAECGSCKQTMQYMTDRPYQYCPYCGAKASEEVRREK